MPWDAFLPLDDSDRRVTTGNTLRHLIDDDRAVQAIWNTIERAEERVWMSMYILAPDEVGRGTLARLTDAARRGCEVLLVYDYAGSIRLRDRDLAPLREAGGRVAVFNRFWPPWKRTGAVALRNHRKIILVDGTAALCGGLNLSEDFAGDAHGARVFDDTVVLLEGPAVGHLAEVFLRTWHELTGERHTPPGDVAPQPDDVRVEVLETDPRRPETRLRAVVEAAVARAARRCYVVTPYFVPAGWMIDALVAAADRGTDVQVMTAGRSDVAVARAAGRHCYGRLLQGGVRIFELFGRVLHSKTVTIDGAFGVVGSYNLDQWTARHTLDASVAFADEALATSLEDEFATFKKDASEYTLARYEARGWPTRLLHAGAHQVARRV